MDYQKIILVGNATTDSQKRTSKSGDVSFVTFSLAVGDRKDQVNFFPVTVFGKLGEALLAHITKGRQVLVEGRVNVSEKGRFNVIADQIRLGAKPNQVQPEK